MSQNTVSTSKSKLFTTKVIARTAILGAIAFILMMLDFALPIFPSFYKIDFSEVAVLVGGFAMGPIPAVAIEGLKVILNCLFQGSATAYVGEIANFLIGCAFVVPASIMYRKNKSKETAIKGLVVGSLCMTAAGVILNYFVLLPAYSFFFHMDMDVLVSMGTAIIPAIKDRLGFVLLATTPFNLIKGIIVSVMTMLIYKHISPLMHR
ncbi:MAG: ECF transporter S component [Erysipelotrichia bacterium]|nr:ECF transporter S component [Erysipelotrichia bacterium]